MLNNSKVAMTAIKSTVYLALHVLSKVESFQNSDVNPEDITRLANTITHSLHQLLSEWIVRGEVIGGSFFGGSVKYNGSVPDCLRKSDQEMKV